MYVPKVASIVFSTRNKAPNGHAALPLSSEYERKVSWTQETGINGLWSRLPGYAAQACRHRDHLLQDRCRVAAQKRTHCLVQDYSVRQAVRHVVPQFSVR